MAKTSTNVKDKTGIVDAMVQELSKKGSVRLVHFGLFKVRKIKGRKRYDFKERKMVAMKPFKQIIFSPARGIREMLRDGKMAAE